jgi:hypothetical protein
MQWSANKAVKLIESGGQHGTSVLYLSLRIGRTKVPGKELDYAQGWGKRKERKDEEAPSKKWEKNSMHWTVSASKQKKNNGTTVQQHSLTQNLARNRAVRAQLLSSTKTAGSSACMQICNASAVKQLSQKHHHLQPPSPQVLHQAPDFHIVFTATKQ